MCYISIARTGNVIMYALGSFSGKQFPYDGRLNADTELSLFVCKQPLGGGGSVVIPSGHSIKKLSLVLFSSKAV